MSEPMSEEWAPRRFGDFAHVVHGWPFRSEDYAPDVGDLPVVVSIGNFEYSGGFRFGQTARKRYSADYPPEYELSPGDLLLVMTCQTQGGEILGVPARVPDDGYVYLHNQRIGRVEIDRPLELDPDFAFHLCRTAEFNRQLFITSSGSKILHTAPRRIEAVMFSRPPICEQRRIAEVLGALDDKIAANASRAAKADDLLAAIFARATVAAAPGTLEEVADVNCASTKPKASGLIHYLDIAAVGVGKYELPAPVEWVDAPGRARRVLQHGDIVWSTVRPNRRSHALVLDEIDSLIGSTGLAVLRPKKGRFAYVYEATRTEAFTAYLDGVAEGSAYPAVRGERFLTAPIPVAREVEIERFEAVAAPIRRWSHAATVESRTLAAIRDALLPLLMSGKIKVKDAERVVEGVV